MKLPKWLDDLLEYIDNNMILIMKSIIAAILIVAGPVIAILLRMQGESYGVIILVGLIFEIIGTILFVLFVRKDLDKEESRQQATKKPIKEKRELPKTI
jgi:hypothetical protein